jgi:hypothetical protein
MHEGRSNWAAALSLGCAFIVAGFLLTRLSTGNFLGLASDFWSGFSMGIGIVLIAVGIVTLLRR